MIMSILASAGLVIANKVEFSSTLSVLHMNTNSANQNEVYSYFPQPVPDKIPNLAATFPFHIFSTSVLSEDLTVRCTVSAVNYILTKNVQGFCEFRPCDDVHYAGYCMLTVTSCCQ